MSLFETLLPLRLALPLPNHHRLYTVESTRASFFPSYRYRDPGALPLPLTSRPKRMGALFRSPEEFGDMMAVPSVLV